VALEHDRRIHGEPFGGTGGQRRGTDQEQAGHEREEGIPRTPGA
jgi:hypothetical protein